MGLSEEVIAAVPRLTAINRAHDIPPPTPEPSGFNTRGWSLWGTLHAPQGGVSLSRRTVTAEPIVTRTVAPLSLRSMSTEPDLTADGTVVDVPTVTEGTLRLFGTAVNEAEGMYVPAAPELPAEIVRDADPRLELPPEAVRTRPEPHPARRTAIPAANTGQRIMTFRRMPDALGFPRPATRTYCPTASFLSRQLR